jgi:hypothetical protein
MNDTAASQKCAHPQCQCQLPIGKEYCGETCRSANDWEPCQCGHPACMTENLEENVG